MEYPCDSVLAIGLMQRPKMSLPARDLAKFLCALANFADDGSP